MKALLAELSQVKGELEDYKLAFKHSASKCKELQSAPVQLEKQIQFYKQQLESEKVIHNNKH